MASKTAKEVFEGSERGSMPLMSDAIKALEAAGVTTVLARDGANGRVKRIIMKGQTVRASAEKLCGNLGRRDG